MTSQANREIPLALISPEFLHSNSTSHTWPFSAVAELIDNAYDVCAKQVWIKKEVFKHTDCLIFLDNGQGMDYAKMHRMLSFGYSDKQGVKDYVPVGLYGNGFKSGSMRLGKDAIVFSKQADTMCVGLLSQTYLERTGAKSVVVPVVMFTYTGQTIRAAPEHTESLRAILTHSLFNTVEELQSEFKSIEMLNTSTGTCVIIWNLRTKSSGELELDFMKDPKDIRILDDVYKTFRDPKKRQGQESKSVPESVYSLRAYCKILYLNPKIKIILQGETVETQSITTTLAKPYLDKYKPDCFKEKITITFGYNKKSNEHYGLMMYHKNRLIKAYVRVSCQRKTDNTGQGVIGVIECNHLKPTHNKQDFDDTQEYRNTMQSLNKKLEQYWRNVSYSYQAFKPVKNTDETTEVLQQEKTEQSPVNPSPPMPVTPSTSDDAILGTSVSTTLKRKKKSLNPTQEKSKTKARRKGSDKNTPDFPPLCNPATDPNTTDCKDLKTALKKKSDVIDQYKTREDSSKIPKSRFEDQQKVKMLYYQVIEATTVLQNKLRELKQFLKTEEVDTTMHSLEYEWINCCESLQKDLEEIKTESKMFDTKMDSLDYQKWKDCCESLKTEGIKIESEKVKVKEECATPVKEASDPGQEKDPQLRILKDETQEISKSLRLRELRQRMAHRLVTYVPTVDLEKVINQILSHDVDEISTRDLPFEESNQTISTQQSHTKYLSAATNVFTPELVQHHADSGAYRFLCSHAGVFSCKLTDVSFDMKSSGEVLYTVESWDNSQLQGVGHFKPAGPLYNIHCSEDSILYVYLPHCEINTGKNNLELVVAHFSEDNVEIIQPLNITSTHVIFKVHSLSLFGLLKKWFFSENPISAQVLLFYKEIFGNERRRKLHIHLVPGNVPVDKVQKQHQCNKYIQCSSICTLTPGKKYRPHCEPYVSQPRVERFGCDFGPNYHPTFEVILNAEVENLTLGLLDETGQEVWEPRQVFLTDENRDTVQVEMNKDLHRDILIQKILPILEIADTLLTKKLLTQEMYNEIIEATTPQKKIRTLYIHLNSRAVKAEFYKILKEKQPELVKDLESRSHNR